MIDTDYLGLINISAWF